MNKIDLIKKAKKYLKERHIDYAEPIILRSSSSDVQEVIFTHPLMLDPSVAVVEPSEIIVLIDITTEKVTLKYMM